MTTRQQHNEDSPDDSIRGRNIQVVKIALGKETLGVVLLLAAIIGACGLIMGLNLSTQAAMAREFQEHRDNDRASFRKQSDELTAQMKDVKTQEWLKERRLMDAEALLLREGFMKPEDAEFGPAGNIHYQKKGK